MFIYTPDIKGLTTLDKEESSHAVRVMRLKANDVITLVDGKGGLYEARIVDPHHKKCKIEVFKHFTEYGKRPYKLHIAIAPTKNIDRFEWFIEKATEIGIDEITPLLCERSERKHVNAERLQRVMIAAIKQSKKAYLPHLNEMIPFDKWLKSYNVRAGLAFIGICNADAFPQPLKSLYLAKQNTIVAIGPEGDFSPQELNQALQCDFLPISLGQSRLRTETAGVVACHTINFINEN